MFSFILYGWSDDSFITKDEYAKMLYNNPRGIGCQKCHGDHGKGMVLSQYKDGNKTIVIKTPDITKLNFKTFYKALNSSNHKLMPYYFLSDKEIKTLFYYLKKKKR